MRVVVMCQVHHAISALETDMCLALPHPACCAERGNVPAAPGGQLERLAAAAGGYALLCQQRSWCFGSTVLSTSPLGVAAPCFVTPPLLSGVTVSCGCGSNMQHTTLECMFLTNLHRTFVLQHHI